MTTQTIPRRDQIPVEHTWNAESVFASVDDWEAEFARVEAQIPGLARFRGRLGDGAAILTQWLAAADTLSTDLGKLQTYAVMGTRSTRPISRPPRVTTASWDCRRAPRRRLPLPSPSYWRSAARPCDHGCRPIRA